MLPAHARAAQIELSSSADARQPRVPPPWATAPTDDDAFDAYLLDSRRPDFEAMLVCRREDRAILGFFNLSHITRGSLQSAYLGYAVGQQFTNQGYMREGIELVSAKRSRPCACTGSRPTSSLATRHRSRSPAAPVPARGLLAAYLKIGGRWRDHERWAILAEDWRERQGRLALPTEP